MLPAGFATLEIPAIVGVYFATIETEERSGGVGLFVAAGFVVAVADGGGSRRDGDLRLHQASAAAAGDGARRRRQLVDADERMARRQLGLVLRRDEDELAEALAL